VIKTSIIIVAALRAWKRIRRSRYASDVPRSHAVDNDYADYDDDDDDDGG